MLWSQPRSLLFYGPQTILRHAYQTSFLLESSVSSKPPLSFQRVIGVELFMGIDSSLVSLIVKLAKMNSVVGNLLVQCREVQCREVQCREVQCREVLVQRVKFDLRNFRKKIDQVGVMQLARWTPAKNWVYILKSEVLGLRAIERRYKAVKLPTTPTTASPTGLILECYMHVRRERLPAGVREDKESYSSERKKMWDDGTGPCTEYTDGGREIGKQEGFRKSEGIGMDKDQHHRSRRQGQAHNIMIRQDKDRNVWRR
ncbi:hypothetical protein B0T20DRAFT_388274 [Sordaria brevicollis]|uniref:Uncharacterized protein n=1 Tax=Sordaria brevicollis TaxID=83679 RepID=A0AAE0PMD9_SORBR|nr:hypothetical protein B0T20DRAFT_388274 [Sordaria brevicollis]